MENENVIVRNPDGSVTLCGEETFSAEQVAAIARITRIFATDLVAKHNRLIPAMEAMRALGWNMLSMEGVCTQILDQLRFMDEIMIEMDPTWERIVPVQD